MHIEWYDLFETELNSTFLITQKVIILGDLNIDFLKDVPKRWSELYYSFSLYQVVNQPTRTTSTSSTLIDHIYVNKPEYVQDSKVFQASLSDHFIIGVCWKLSNIFIKQSEHKYLSFSKINEEKFNVELCISRSKLFNVVLEANSINLKPSMTT